MEIPGVLFCFVLFFSLLLYLCCLQWVYIIDWFAFRGVSLLYYLACG